MSLSPEAIAYQEANINDNRQPDFIIASVICLTAAYTAVALRFLARRLVKAGLQIDDWVITVALFLTTIYVGDAILDLRYGVGKHVILVTDPVGFVKNSIVSSILYNPAIACTKISILLMYRRLFPTRQFLIAVYSVGALVLCYTTAAVLVFLLQCIPIQANWMNSIESTCINVDLALTLFGVINVITDVIIIILPIPQLWHLSMSRSQKLQLTGVFMTGAVVSAIGIVRVIYIDTVSFQDVTWTLTDSLVWTIAEVCVAVVSACLPTLRPLFSVVKHGGSGMRSAALGSGSFGKLSGSDNSSVRSPAGSPKHLIDRRPYPISKPIAQDQIPLAKIKPMVRVGEV